MALTAQAQGNPSNQQLARQERTFDGEWWLSLDSGEQSGFLNGAADCLTWVARAKWLTHSVEGLEERIPDFYAIRLNFQPPQNEGEFERLCLKLLRVHWTCPASELYARRGEKHYGIDIIDPGGSLPLRALGREGGTVTLSIRTTPL